MILIVRDRAFQEQIEMMLTEHKLYIKLAVDIERHILAGGGEMHSDCEFVLLNDRSWHLVKTGAEICRVWRLKQFQNNIDCKSC